MNSYKNKSGGGRDAEGARGNDFVKIKDNVDPKPPAGASNSYEKVREKIDRKDSSALHKNGYTREKLMNK